MVFLIIYMRKAKFQLNFIFSKQSVHKSWKMKFYPNNDATSWNRKAFIMKSKEEQKTPSRYKFNTRKEKKIITYIAIW